MNQYLSNRPNFLDYSKVIGIFLVIFGHYVYRLNLPFENNSLWNGTFNVTLFHMPLFFIISGILFKPEKTFISFLKKSLHRLLIPYLYMSLISLAIGLILLILHSDTNSIVELFILVIKNGARCVLGILSGGDLFGYGHNTYASPLWFVFSLFWIQFLMTLFKKSNIHKYIISAIVTLLFILILLKGNFLAFRICSSAIGLIFFSTGYYAKKYFMKIGQFSNLKLVSLFLLTLFIVCLCAHYGFDYSSRNGFFSINSLKFGNYPILFFVSGIAGSIMMFSLAQLTTSVCRKSVLRLSNGTLVVLGFHSIIYLMFVGIVESENIIVAILFSFIVLLLSYGLVILSNKYLPALLGGRVLYEKNNQ